MYARGMKVVHRAQPSWGVGDVLGIADEGRLLQVRFAGRQGAPILVSAKDPALARFRFAPGDEVGLDGGKAKIIEGRENRLTPLYRYTVELPDGTRKGVAEAELSARPPRAGALEQLALGRAGGADSYDLRRRTVKLDLERRADALGALFGSRVMPRPHQLGVVQRVLSARKPRFVLADEVGLGKTIEAGMVFSALSQAGLARRVLVVAPAHLQVQWLAELYYKFHTLFTLLDGERLAKEAKIDPARSPFERYPRVVTSLELLARSEEYREMAAEAGWDLAIFDEAHHLVSPKAFEAASSVAAASHGLLLLTATPMQLDPREHFQLLSLVDPAAPESLQAFLARMKRQGDLSDRTRQLLEAPGDSKTAKSIAAMLPHDATLKAEAGAVGRDPEATERFLAHLAETYSVSARLIRNRRAVVGGMATRRRVRHDVTPGAEEQQLLAEVREELAHGRLHATGAALATLLRRVESSPRAAAAALAAHRNATLARKAAALEGPTHDAKARALVELASSVRAAEPGAKLLVFTEARETQEYVKEVLARAGVAAALYHGDLSQLDRDRQVARFRDPDGPPVLVSTEVGGEGRNFQFCHHLVNYDLTWSPAAVEQRIGRLDRIGQVKEVQVHCLRVDGTLSAHVFDLLDGAVGVFEETVGGLDPVLEDVETEIVKLALAGGGAGFERFGQELAAKVAAAREEVRRAYDPLLDLRSSDAAGVRALATRAAERLGLAVEEGEDLEQELWRIARDLDERLEETVTQLARKVGIGVDTEEHVEAFQAALRFGGKLEVDQLPGYDIGEDRTLLGTFWRDTAVVQEEIDYFATGHPLVEALFAWMRDGELGRSAWLRCDEVRPAAMGFAFCFVVAFPEPEDLAAGPRVPSRQAARHLGLGRIEVAVECARGGGKPHERPVLLASLDEPDAVRPPEAPAAVLGEVISQAHAAAREIARLKLREASERAAERLAAERDAALARLELAATRGDAPEASALREEEERIRASHDAALAALGEARLELDQAAGLLPEEM